jgi:hypothetical protein
MHSNNNLNHMSNGVASKELANSLIESEAQMDRIEHSISQIETVENSQAISEINIPTEDRFNEINIATQNEAENEELNDSESNPDNAIISSHSDHLQFIEPKKEEVISNNESKIENDLIDNNAPPELHQEIHHIETPIVSENQTIENAFNSTFSEESNSNSPLISLEIRGTNNEQADSFNASLKTSVDFHKRDFIRKDSIQILLAFALTCILLAAGWLLGQAS